MFTYTDLSYDLSVSLSIYLSYVHCSTQISFPLSDETTDYLMLREDVHHLSKRVLSKTGIHSFFFFSFQGNSFSFYFLVGISYAFFSLLLCICFICSFRTPVKLISFYIFILQFYALPSFHVIAHWEIYENKQIIIVIIKTSIPCDTPDHSS